MPDLIVFTIVIPCTDDSTGLVHPPEKFDGWVLDTFDRFRGISVLGLGLRGLWYDKTLPPKANPVEDHSNRYRIGVPPDREEELRAHVKATARLFGQRILSDTYS